MAREATKPQRATTPEEWQRVREILANALELASAERSSYLDRACNADAELRAHLDELIAAHESTGASGLDSPAFVVTSSGLPAAEPQNFNWSGSQHYKPNTDR